METKPSGRQMNPPQATIMQEALPGPCFVVANWLQFTHVPYKEIQGIQMEAHHSTNGSMPLTTEEPRPDY